MIEKPVSGTTRITAGGYHLAALGGHSGDDRRARAQPPGGWRRRIYEPHWTTGTPEGLRKDSRALGAPLNEAGRMEPSEYIHTSWRTGTRLGSLLARPEQVL
jgi:hypothetical protein